MKNKSTEIVNKYNQNKHLYTELGEVVYSLLKTLVKTAVHTHQVTCRVKDRESLATKIIRKNYKYKSLEQITDIVGFRIILFFEDDIDEVERIIRREFEVDEVNSVDKRHIDADRFGYRSLHYVVSLNKTRLGLLEYKKFQNLKFEIQIRSILQHSWAEIEHDIGYKGANEIPDTAKRTFYRIAALLEQADIEFVKLKKELKVHESNLITKIAAETIDILIDKASLKAFILESPTVSKLEKEIEQFFCPRDANFYPAVIDNLLPRLQENGIKSVYYLDKLLNTKKEELIAWVKEAKKGELAKFESFFQGSAILWLLNVIEQ